jgi:hypothetical protein
MRDGLLLCELHAHTTWSDGHLTLSELVDLYGRAGFDVLAVTDHAVRLDDPSPRAVDSWAWPAYNAAVRAEAERALAEYGLLLIQGLELSDNTPVEDGRAQQDLLRAFDVLLADNASAWEMSSEGRWMKLRPKKGDRGRQAQQVFMRSARARARRRAASGSR